MTTTSTTLVKFFDLFLQIFWIKFLLSILVSNFESITIGSIRTLNVDQWNLLSNLIYCYDEYSGFSMAERYTRVNELFASLMAGAQLLFEKNPHFLLLSSQDPFSVTSGENQICWRSWCMFYITSCWIVWQSSVLPSRCAHLWIIYISR